MKRVFITAILSIAAGGAAFAADLPHQCPASGSGCLRSGSRPGL